MSARPDFMNTPVAGDSGTASADRSTGRKTMRTVATPTDQAPADANWQYRCIYAVTFTVFLAVVIVARLLPARWRPWPTAGHERLSIFAETRAVTSTIIPFAFMA